MKLIFSFLLLAFLSLASYAQVSDSTAVHKKKKSKVEYDVAINTTFFVKQIINLSSSNLEISPYIVGFNLFPVRDHGIRLAVGGSFTHSTQTPDSTFVQISKTSEVDYRIGYEYRHFFGKRWVFFAGVDFINSFTVNSTKVNSSTDIITTSNNTMMLGGGPVLGIQVNISRHISLFTETAFYYSYATTTSKTNSLNFPDLNVNKVSDIEETGKFVLPTSLYFVFRF
jgi:hypothetical protein